MALAPRATTRSVAPNRRHDPLTCCACGESVRAFAVLRGGFRVRHVSGPCGETGPIRGNARAAIAGWNKSQIRALAAGRPWLEALS